MNAKLSSPSLLILYLQVLLHQQCYHQYVLVTSISVYCEEEFLVTVLTEMLPIMLFAHGRPVHVMAPTHESTFLINLLRSL